VAIILPDIRRIVKASKLLFQAEPRSVTILAVSQVVSLLLLPAELYVVKLLVDRVQAWGQTVTIASIAMAASLVVAVLTVKALVPGTLAAMAMIRTAEVGQFELEQMVSEHTTRLPLYELENPATKDKRNRALRASLVSMVIDGMEYLRQLLHFLILLIALSILGHWLVAIAIGLFLFLPFLIHSRTAEGMEQLARRQTASRRMAEYLAGLMVQTRAAREIRLFDLGAHLKQRWALLLEANARETLNLGIKGEMVKFLPDLILASLGSVVVLVGILLTRARGGTAGDFTVFFQAVAMMFTAVPGLIAMHGHLRTLGMQWDDLEAFRSMPTEEEEESEMAAPTGAPMGVEFQNVSFKYPTSDREALRAISFKIPPRHRVAIVGENGAGKSTLVKLLLGFYQPTEGEICWTTASERLSSVAARQNLSAVFQDFARLLLTVRENVAIGQLEHLTNDEKLLGALTKSSALDMVPSLDVQLGAQFGGPDLSGGQWQRLATARAYLKQSTFLCFDEPTASLDPKAEAEVFRTFLDLVEGQSAILVTHRIGAARLADWILVMKDGALVEQGNHESLLRVGGEYERLYNLQAEWYR
jgi:ATP-binding cassette subfamily B protein